MEHPSKWLVMKSRLGIPKPADWQKRFNDEKKVSPNLQAICAGLAQMKCVEFRTRKGHYVAEVHTIGFSSASGEIAFTAHPLDEKTPPPGKNPLPIFELNDVRRALLLDRDSQAPRMGHRKDSPRFNYIVNEVDHDGPKIPRSVENASAKAEGSG